MAMGPSSRNGILVLLACMILTLALGSVHAFSIFLDNLEERFDVSRSEVSLIYSFALASITVSVFFGHHIYNRLHPVLLLSLIILISSAGCVLSAEAPNLYIVWLGYSVLFGGANGLGYGFALQCSAQANPSIKGLSMGCVTATYALGAALAPVPFEILLNRGGFTLAMNGLAIAMLIISPFVVYLLVKGKAILKVTEPKENNIVPGQRWLIVKLWFGYGTAVAAGLMIMGHATGIAKSGNIDDQQVVYAPIIIALFNMFGSLVGGWFSDKVTIRKSLMAFPALSIASLIIISLFGGSLVTVCGLALIGFTYGATIVAYPAAVVTLFGVVSGVRVYGRVFTAWGMAGLFAPWFAGVLFEHFGNYQIALATAASVGVVSVMIAYSLPTESGNIPDGEVKNY